MELLERGAELRELDAAVARARLGQGGVVLVSGEAGIGKTSLLLELAARISPSATVLFGACEALLTPRPLGPFRDMAREQDGFDTSGRDAVIDALLAALGRSTRPTAVIVDDAQWADDASIDVLRYLGRRVHRLPAVLVISFRDDELAEDHPLRRVVGALTGPAVRHLELRGLSDDAVARLAAAAGLDTGEVVAAVGGNPFFLTELLASSPGPSVPPSVRHAVLARAAALPPSCRAALDQLAVVPAEAPRSLVTALLDDPGVLEPAERRGILVATPTHVRFRHELARRAIEQGVPQSRRAGLHARVLAALADTGVDASRLVHHAVAAGDDRAVAEHAVAAAEKAAAAGGHRETLAFARLAIERGAGLDGRGSDGRGSDGRGSDRCRLARLHGMAASALYALNRFGEAARHAGTAVELWDAAGVAPLELGEALLIRARLSTFLADPAAARSAALRARDVLEPLGPSRALARCYSTLGSQDAIQARHDSSLDWTERALSMAERTGDREVEARALCSRGLARVSLGRACGYADLERSVELADRYRLGDCLAAAAYNLAVVHIRDGRPDRAERYLAAAERAVREHDLAGIRFPVQAQRAHLLLLRGDWDDAHERLRALVDRSADPGANLVLPLAFLARLLARRGDPAAADLAERAWSLAEATGEHQKLAVAAEARLEVAWLRGDDRAVRTVAAQLVEIATAAGNVSQRGGALRYLRRIGLTAEPFPGCPPALAAGIAGACDEAAKLWDEAGNPYEQALELSESPDPGVALAGLRILDDLGAVAAAALVRRRLRGDGLRRVPRGPSAATRANPCGLTARQLDVVALLADGRTNAEIAAELYLSARTVDNHVAAVLTKLGVGSRRAAVARAVDAGLIPRSRRET